MIDFIKIESEIEDINQFHQNSNLDFIANISLRDGAGDFPPVYETDSYLIYVSTATRDDLTYKISEFLDKKSKISTYKLEITGSIHKKHYKGNNYEDFDYPMLCEQIEFIKSLKGLGKLFLKNVEFGLNVQVDFEILDYLLSSVIVYKGDRFNYYNPGSNGMRIGVYQKMASKVEIKLYNKSIQSNTFGNLLRYEIKYTRMQKLNKMTIYTIDDLLIKENLNKLLIEYKRMFNNIILLETPRIKLSEKQEEYHFYCSNPNYWENLKKNAYNIEYQNERRRFMKFQENYCHNRKKELLNMFEERYAELIES
jgi:hypothetical protein